MSVDKELVELYLADNFEALRELVRIKDIQELKRIERLPVLAQGLFKDLLRNLDDQEKAYITGSRYLSFMDHALRYSADKIFLELRYGSEYLKVKTIMSDLEAELIDRYDERANNKGRRRSRKRGSSGHSSDEQQSDIVYIQPTSPGSGDIMQSVSISIFISTVELYDALMKNENLLIVDMRDPADYQESRIMTPLGHSVNIPEDIVIPGLSANTLGQLLTEEAQEVWDERDNFDMIVLLDWDTDNFNFSGSRLERLRCCIVEWDLNRNYTRLPVVLNGGFKEFLECYPSEVTNCHIFLSRTNSEIDDLLTIDNVSYPDAGSGGNINLKVRTIASFADIQARIQRDFGDMEITLGPPARPSRSEGQLPRDYYSSQEGKSPYKSLSQESLPRDYIASDTFVEPLPFPALEFPKDEDVEATPAEVVADVKAEGDDMAAEIKIAIDAEKAEMLSRVRALKPKSPRGDDPKDVIIRNLIQENKGLFVRPGQPPAVDRSFKPARVVVTRDGYTGIRNIRNNCYVSCMMQCLKVLPLIKSMFVMSNEYKHHVHKESPIVVLEFAMLMKSLWEGSIRKPKCYNPDDFLEKVYELNPIYAKGNHEDTFEYFILLFNNLSDDCSVELPHRKIMTETERSWYSQLQGRSSFFVDMFYYQLRNTKVCWRCQKINYVFDNDSTLMVSISENKGENRVEDLLKEFLKDNLVPDYSCAECKHSATIVNKKAIVVEPEILVIIIKRYTATKDGSIKKNETEITFPVDRLEFGNSYYKLYAIPQHTGSMMVGHYFASVLLNDATNTWVQFNDERILSYATPITDVPGIKSSCVGFFYVRQAQKISEPQTECDKESFK